MKTDSHMKNANATDTRRHSRFVGIVVGIACMVVTAAAAAGSTLRCDVTYAGTVHPLRFEATSQPYAVAPIDIAGRFLFKGVLLSDKKPAHVSLYVYLQQEPRPYLLQHAIYPALTGRGQSFTGEQHVYGGTLERELMYRCWLDH